MEPSVRPRAKICCISSTDEARRAVHYGASALGLVSAMPSGPGVISDQLIAGIAARVPPGVATFLLTSRQSADEIVEQQHRMRTTTLQLCDRVPLHELVKIRDMLPGVGLVQVIHVAGEESIDEAVAVSRFVDAILLDSGKPSLQVKELGGTGRIHDWSISRRIREAVPVPLYLAGGLTPGNVADAVKLVQPFAVDVCSGVRTNGRLDEEKLSRFMAAIGSS